MALPNATPLLDLEAITEYPSVKIGGVLYGLLPLDALSVFQFQRLKTLAPQIGRFLETAEVTEAESDAADTVLTQLCQIVLEAPLAVLESLTTLQKLSVYTAFLTLPRPSLLRPVGSQPQAEETTPSLTGATSSPASAGSTAGPPLTGSRKPRSRS